jgi:hypothetical protein
MVVTSFGRLGRLKDIGFFTVRGIPATTDTGGTTGGDGHGRTGGGGTGTPMAKKGHDSG